jgi:hypothetical protein
LPLLLLLLLLPVAVLGLQRLHVHYHSGNRLLSAAHELPTRLGRSIPLQQQQQWGPHRPCCSGSNAAACGSTSS